VLKLAAGIDEDTLPTTLVRDSLNPLLYPIFIPTEAFHILFAAWK